MNRADSTISSLRIVAIDGSLKFADPSTRHPIDPGLRSLVLEAPSPVQGNVVRKTITFPVEPCTTYEVVAKRQAVSDVDWKLLVADKRSVPNCDVEAERRKAGIAR